MMAAPSSNAAYMPQRSAVRVSMSSLLNSSPISWNMPMYSSMPPDTPLIVPCRRHWQAQRTVDALWRSPADWWRASILNTARMSWFSSDRAIRDYAREIWHVPVE